MPSAIHNYISGSLPEDIEVVVFGWHNRFGHCDDCGLPAAYFIDRDPASRYCCVCAAEHAASGEAITRLDPED